MQIKIYRTIKFSYNHKVLICNPPRSLKMPKSKTILYERRVSMLFVKKGMFIVRLDRPWLDTPFWLQGFSLQTDMELDALKKYCRSVYIDISRGIEAEYYMEEDLQLPTTEALEKQISKKRLRFSYKNKISLKDELIEARNVLEASSRDYVRVLVGLNTGNNLDISEIYQLIEPMMESVLRNSDALLLLTRLKNDSYSIHDRAIFTCVLALCFGRYLSLQRDDLLNMAAGALLLDIGKINVAKEILNKTETLTDDEYAQACTHVEHGLIILKKDENIHEDIFNMVRAHHERKDGSGYPNGLKTVIPAFARVAGVIDCYSAMCSHSPYSESYTPYAALQEIYNQRDKFFQPELVEKILSCLGVYPDGSLVEFKTGEVGVVLAQNYTSRIKPVVFLLLNENKKPYKEFKIIDMEKQKKSSAAPLVILKDLKRNAYDIDLQLIYKKLEIVLQELDVPVTNPSINFLDKLVNIIERIKESVIRKIKK